MNWMGRISHQLFYKWIEWVGYSIKNVIIHKITRDLHQILMVIVKLCEFVCTNWYFLERKLKLERGQRQVQSYKMISQDRMFWYCSNFCERLWTLFFLFVIVYFCEHVWTLCSYTFFFRILILFHIILNLYIYIYELKLFLVVNHHLYSIILISLFL